MTVKTIAFVIFDRFQILDLSGPLAAFEIASRFCDTPAYTLRVLSPAPGLVRSSSGVGVWAEALTDAKDIDTVLVVGGQGTTQAAVCPDLKAFLLGCDETRRRGSICSGTYILAEAGLLDARRATTHWERGDHFARRYPAVRLEPDRIFVADGPIWTSAGVTAGIDMVLAMIAQDLGEALAQRVAQEMVVYYRRPGGQSQFSALLDMGSASGPFAALMGWMRENLSQCLDVDTLAAQACMSPRHFSRRFTRDMGVSPARAVERLRLEVARQRVENERTPVEIIARDTGFHDPERMRRAFLRAFGQPPQALRRHTSGGDR